MFVGGTGQAVAWDETLEGNIFRSSRHVDKETLVGEIEAGAALMLYGFRLTYAHVTQTPEFKHQHGGAVNFDSISISFHF